VAGITMELIEAMDDLTQVTVWFHGEPEEKLAVFTLGPNGSVVCDGPWGMPYMHDGVAMPPSYSKRMMPGDGVAFLKALLTLNFGASYFSWVPKDSEWDTDR
jgi:hypothetical protein